MMTVNSTAHRLLMGAANGGGTVWAEGCERDHGYLVGGAAPALKLRTVFGPAVVSWVAQNAATAECVGTWVDSGETYFDVNTWIEDRAEAIALGMARGELAIWDIANAVAIDLR